MLLEGYEFVYLKKNMPKFTVKVIYLWNWCILMDNKNPIATYKNELVSLTDNSSDC